MSAPDLSAEARYEALATAEPSALQSLADAILADGPTISVLAGPEAVTAPVRTTVPTGSGRGRTARRASPTAVLGHAALTTCTVLLAGTRGDGIRSGRDLPGALAAAVCDAEAERQGPRAGEVDDLCQAALSARATRAADRAALVTATRLGDDA